MLSATLKNESPGVPEVWTTAWAGPSMAYRKVREACYTVACEVLKQELADRVTAAKALLEDGETEVYSLDSDATGTSIDIDRCEVSYAAGSNFDNLVLGFMLVRGQPAENYQTKFVGASEIHAEGREPYTHNRWRFVEDGGASGFAEFHRQYAVTDIRYSGDTARETQLLSKEKIADLRKFSNAVEQRLSAGAFVAVKPPPWQRADAPCWPISQGEEDSEGPLNICRECETFLPVEVSECFCCGSRTVVLVSAGVWHA
jgi:hypothetical protein